MTKVVKISETANHLATIYIDRYDDDFDTEATINECGEYAYECRIYGKVETTPEDWEVGLPEYKYCETPYLELVDVWDEDGQGVEITEQERREIEFNLTKNLEVEIYTN